MEGLNWKRKLLFVSVPAVLLVAGGSVAASAATQQAGPTTNPGQPTAAAEPAAELAASTEPAEPVAVAEPAETPETTGTADAGHQDPAGVQSDHQFDGQE